MRPWDRVCNGLAHQPTHHLIIVFVFVNCKLRLGTGQGKVRWWSGGQVKVRWKPGDGQVSVRWSLREFQVKFKISQSKYSLFDITSMFLCSLEREFSSLFKTHLILSWVHSWKNKLSSTLIKAPNNLKRHIFTYGPHLVRGRSDDGLVVR